MLLSLLLLFWVVPAEAGLFDLGPLRLAFQPLQFDESALHPVTTEFGPAVIPMLALPLESELAVASVKPWSSHWFPRADRDLFDDGRGTSILEKYDLVRATATGQESGAARFESDRYEPDTVKWEGLCDAWSIAAILFPEPQKPRSFRLNGGYRHLDNERVAFSVGDQKALLLKTVEAMPAESLKIYGQKFLGDFENWIYPDLLPEELHRFVEKQLFERREPFVMDHDAGVEVWSEPVYKANYKISAVGGRDDAVFVRLWLYSAAPLRKEEKDRTGTKDMVREYNYYLYGKPDGRGSLVVSSGEWAKGELVDSRRDHPDYVFTIRDPAAVKRHSRNPEIDASIVDQIVGR
jgi:hypothetical protein